MIFVDPFEFGLKVHAARKRKKLTQRQAAKKIGIAHITYGAIERGQIDRPRNSTLDKLFDFYPELKFKNNKEAVHD